MANSQQQSISVIEKGQGELFVHLENQTSKKSDPRAWGITRWVNSDKFTTTKIVTNSQRMKASHEVSLIGRGDRLPCSSEDLFSTGGKKRVRGREAGEHHTFEPPDMLSKSDRISEYIDFRDDGKKEKRARKHDEDIERSMGEASPSTTGSQTGVNVARRGIEGLSLKKINQSFMDPSNLVPDIRSPQGSALRVNSWPRASGPVIHYNWSR